VYLNTRPHMLFVPQSPAGIYSHTATGHDLVLLLLSWGKDCVTVSWLYVVDEALLLARVLHA
jgi:hypothetical protein